MGPVVEPTVELAVEAAQQVVGGAAAAGHITVRELRDGLQHLGAGAEAGQRLGGRREAGDGGLAQFGIGQTVPGGVDPQRIARSRQSARPLREGLTVR